MSEQDQTPHNIEVTDGYQLEDEQTQDEEWVISSIKANATSPSFITPSLITKRIHRVPEMVRDTGNYNKYYVPKVVSIGPYHFGNKNLEFVEKIKPAFAMSLVSNNEDTLRRLYKKLGDPNMVQELRYFYEESWTMKFSNKEFTKMMLLDGCFILYYIQYIFGNHPIDCLELKSHQVAFVHMDLLLLENQIPFKVLTEVMKLVKIGIHYRITEFICSNIFTPEKCKRKWFVSARYLLDDFEPDNLLHLLHHTLTKTVNNPSRGYLNPQRWTSRNVNQLVDVGIHFKPSDTMSLAHIKFRKGWSWFSAYVELPPITVDNSTKPMLLNLIAYELCSCDVKDACVTSYICLLDSLIGHPEDVEVLRKVGVLEDCFGRDQEVVKLFNEIATGLVPDPSAYWEGRSRIQRHYDLWKYSFVSQIKHLYDKNPGLFLSYFGVAAIFLSVVQTYFTIWSPKGTCDDLCMFLKKNHHL